MSDKGLEYQKIMNGLGRIPGLNLPIPGLGPSGYNPNAAKAKSNGNRERMESLPVPEMRQTLQESLPRRRTIAEAKENLSVEDKNIFLQTLKAFFEHHAKTNSSLEESKDFLLSLEEVVMRNRGNQFLEKAYVQFLEAAQDFDLARGHLRMVIKNTAEYIKSM
jgi:hypothetical protein